MLQNLKSLNCLINYIIQHELEDYIENPSDDHIYYHALVVAYGIDEANKDLLQALKNNQN